jgi:hypothetical protein
MRIGWMYKLVNPVRAIHSIAVIAVLFGCSVSEALSQNPKTVTPLARTEADSSLIELRDKRSALLVVMRTGIVNASDNEQEIIDKVLKSDPTPRGRFQWVYGTMSKKLNRYIRKYGSLTAASDLSEADFVLFFNLLEFRRILDTTYPFGELFVIVKGLPELRIPPRVIWRSRKVLESSDAIGDFIRELKLLRGEE